jgi:hypothetical protein
MIPITSRAQLILYAQQGAWIDGKSRKCTWVGDVCFSPHVVYIFLPIHKKPFCECKLFVVAKIFIK